MAGGTGVYWTGADGNVYIKQAGQAGVKNFGTASNLAAGSKLSGFNALAGLKQKNDPNAKPASAPANPNAAGSSAPTFANKSNDIGLQNAGLSAVDSQTRTGLGAIDKSLATINGGYDTERAANEKNYGGQSDTNQNNFQKNKQSALIGAAQGRQGLFGTLSSLGALNGSGIDLANRAVQTGANQDLSGAADNFATNQSGLDTAIGTFRNEDDARRNRAKIAADDARTNVNNQAAKSKQTFYSNLANDYAAQGDSGNAGKFTGLAASLYPAVANTSVPNTNLAPEAAAFTPGSLSTYLANAGGTQVSTAPNSSGSSGPGGLPGLIAQNKKKVTA